MASLLKTVESGLNGMCTTVGCASKRNGNKMALRQASPELRTKPAGPPLDGSDEALAQSEALISLIESAIARRTSKLRDQGYSDVAPGEAAQSVAKLIQPLDVDRALGVDAAGRPAAGSSSAAAAPTPPAGPGPSGTPPGATPAGNGGTAAQEPYEYEYYDVPAEGNPEEAEYEYSYTYTYKEGADQNNRGAEVPGLSPDEYEYYYEDAPAPAPARA